MSCSRYMLVRELFLYLQQIIVCVILTLRVYALYGRSRRLLSYVVIIGLALMGGASAGSFGNNSNTAIYIQGSDCHNSFTVKIAMRYGLAWIAVFVFELLIFVLTVFRTCKTRGSPRMISSSRNIIDIMFQDGAMYFAAMTLINLPNILTYYCGSVSAASYDWLGFFLTTDKDITRGNLATFTGCMSVTLVSRLVLHLHKSTDDEILSTAIQNDDSSPNVFTTRLDVEFSSHSFQADSE
ncbi:hypothetical protein BDR06DRAFT_421842 [Suillus hirtellus]|nr:hypothetical protein BDR06DRAFT_421842 [Suillus hirtellus]